MKKAKVKLSIKNLIKKSKKIFYKKSMLNVFVNVKLQIFLKC